MDRRLADRRLPRPGRRPSARRWKPRSAGGWSPTGAPRRWPARCAVPLPEDVDFLNASQEQLAAIRQAVQMLGRKLAARLARKRRHHRRSALDFRRTIRQSLGNGGVPVDLVFRKPHPAKPEIMLIADISSSVSAFATLHAAARLRDQVGVLPGPELRLHRRDRGGHRRSSSRRPTWRPSPATSTAGTGAVRLDGHSDYGMVLESFWDQWGAADQEEDERDHSRGRAQQLPRVAVVGSQVHPPARPPPVLAQPEPAYSWDTGDSIVSEYAKHCDKMVECRNLRQLKEFVEELD